MLVCCAGLLCTALKLRRTGYFIFAQLREEPRISAMRTCEKLQREINLKDVSYRILISSPRYELVADEILQFYPRLCCFRKLSST